MRNRPIRLAVLLQDLEFGGTQRYAVHLLRHLNREVFAPELWLLRGGTDMLAMAQETGVNIVWLSMSRRVGPLSLFNLMWRILHSKPQILYTLTVVPNVWGRLLGRLGRVPVIVSGFRNVVREPLESWLWRLSTRIICNAEAGREFLMREFGANPERIAVVPNAVDTDYFSPNEELRAAQPTVLTIGRLVEQKNHINLLESFRLVLAEIPNARLIIMGNGHLRARLEKLIAFRSLGPNVQLLPASGEIREHLRRSWVFALSSNYEGSPNVVLEAMSCGLPIVSTSVGGVPELVRHRESGILVEPNNPSQLAEALVSVLKDEQTRRAMGIRSRETILKDKTVEKMAGATEKVLLEAVDAGKKGVGKEGSTGGRD